MSVGFGAILFPPMTQNEFALHYHKLRFDLETLRRTGDAFQGLFESIMQKADSSFMTLKPMGEEGDWKADGYSADSKTVYQCYSPERLTSAPAVKKIKEDFSGARLKWKEEMARWTFVWNSPNGLPPKVVATIQELKSECPEVEVDQMGPEGLWKVVRGLPLSDRESMLGVVPSLSAAVSTTAAEIQVLMWHLGEQGPPAAETADLDLTAIAQKLERNHLSSAVSGIVMPSVPVARLVRKFVDGMPEPSFSEAIASALAKKYEEISASTEDPDTIFGGILEYVRGDHRESPKLFWAAAGIVSYYFELCDIFEK